MQTATYEVAIEAVGLLFSPVPIAVAAVVWLLLATGIVGRVVQHLEELPHLRAAQPRLLLHAGSESRTRSNRGQGILPTRLVGPGDRVLDVACGTGVVARTAHLRHNSEWDPAEPFASDANRIRGEREGHHG